MQQYMIDTEIVLGKKINFNNEQNHHIKDVMRMKEKSLVRVVNPFDKSSGFVAVFYEENNAYGEVIEIDEVTHELNVKICLCIGILKKDKWEYLLQKATELGVSKIVPFESERTVVKKNSDKQQKKNNRWNKIMLEASEQSKREIVPELCEIQKFKNILKFKSQINLLAYEDVSHSASSISSTISNELSVTIVIGPEGGFSEKEINYLTDNNFKCVSLGKRILRAETAACHSLSVIGELIG
ncbi:MAG: RsmE family RNA methyltransferase [Anaerorhabdus sp.]